MATAPETEEPPSTGAKRADGDKPPSTGAKRADGDKPPSTGAKRADGDKLPIDELLSRMREALGGEEALARTSCHFQRTVAGGVDSQIQLQSMDELTGRLRVEIEVPALGMRILKGFDGKLAWEVSPMFDGWYGELHPASKELARQLPPLWCAQATEGDAAPRLVEMATDSRGVRCIVVERIALNEADQPVPERTFVDPETFLVRENQSGHGGEEVTTFDDYRPVEGRLFPFRATVMREHGNSPLQITELRVLAAPPEHFAHPTRPRPEATTGSRSADAASLETIWDTVANVYFDDTFGGVDWSAVRERYLPRAEELSAQPGSRAFVNLATEMISELRATHFKVVPRDHVRTGEVRARTPGQVGLDLRWVESRAVVWSKRPGSAVMESPLERGFVVTALNGMDDAALRERHDAAIGHMPNEALRAIMRYVLELQCFADDEVEVDYLDAADAPGSVRLVATPRAAQFDPRFSSRVEDGVLVVAFDIFFGDVAGSFRGALDANLDARALVIDLRGNPGGAATIPGRIAGCLSDAGSSLGRMVYRKESTVFDVAASEPQFRGPVALLVDSGSGSCSELLAGSLQEVGRARIFGRTTAGAVLPSTMTLLPNGCQFQYAICDYVTAKGQRLEGVGVTPDEPIALHRADLLAGRDADMEAALAWIRTR